jgi:hypothetical protein
MSAGHIQSKTTISRRECPQPLDIYPVIGPRHSSNGVIKGIIETVGLENCKMIFAQKGAPIRIGGVQGIVIAISVIFIAGLQ